MLIDSKASDLWPNIAGAKAAKIHCQCQQLWRFASAGSSFKFRQHGQHRRTAWWHILEIVSLKRTLSNENVFSLQHDVWTLSKILRASKTFTIQKFIKRKLSSSSIVFSVVSVAVKTRFSTTNFVRWQQFYWLIQCV